MAREQFVNDAATTLNGAINATVTSVTVTSGAVFPADGDFRILINSEIMKVTARTTNVLTVVRAQEGTTAASHADTDAVTSILTGEALTTYANDAMGLGILNMGGAVYRKPFRLLDFDGNTLTSSDFTAINLATGTVTDEPTGTITVEVPETTGDWRVFHKAMPTPPFAVTACMQFGPGMTRSSSGSAFAIGNRESATGELNAIVAEIGDLVRSYRYDDPGDVTPANMLTGNNAYSLRYDTLWLKFVDDNINIYLYTSVDGIRWILNAQDVRDVFLTPDQIWWGVNPRGGANKLFHLMSWVEHEDDVPLGLDFQVQQVELLTDIGTTQDITPSFPNLGAAMVFNAGGEGVAAGTASTHASMSMGYTDFSNVHCIGAYSADGVSTDDSRGLKANTRFAQYIEDTDTPTGRATPTKVGNDLRLTWNTHITTGETQGAVVLLGGSYLQSTVMSVSPTQAVVDTAEAFTGVGFAPDALICLQSHRASFSGFSLSDHNSIGIGFAVNGGSQASCTMRNADAVTTTETASYTSDAWYTSRFSSDTVAHGEEVTTWGTDGITHTNRGTGGWTSSISYLFLKMTKPTDAEVIDFTWAASTGNQSFTFSFKPRFVIMASTLTTALNTIEDIDACLSVSVMDADTQCCSSQIMADNVGTTECQSMFSEKALKIPTTTGGTLWEADFVEFTDTGFTLNFTTVDVAVKAIAIGFK